MASSSTSSVDKSFKYDVFLSFRGEDTRTNFIDHLYHALQNKSIHTYKDDEKIKKGKNISDELIGSIEDSKFYIIVFSKNYASSSWCLDELVKIMECHRTNEHTAYPVFYDVEPSEVRKQSGPVAEAFAKHEKEEAAGKWREALKESADLSGWELKKTADGGEDTRTDFIDHLYHALQNKSIHTYKDDEKIKKGKNISDELVKIMEWQRTNEHTAYPVFYDVEPSEVRKQSGLVAEAFAKHEKEEAAGKWREALKESADLCGWELKKTADGHEAKVIQRIVEEISLELRSISFNIDEKLVGMETRIEDLVPSLGIGCDDVRMIGIKGMGGGGKTTLARAVFDHISFRFEGKSFVENVRESASLSGLKSLQKQVLSDVLNDKDINISSVYDGKHMMKRRLRDKKVIVVLDDVDHINQLEALVGEPNWFKHGSKIIITTRDEQVLVAHGVKFIHDVNLLSDMEATCLFNRFAFGRDIPIQGYEELSRQVVRYAAGLPLTIRVLGSFLCGKDELEWIDALERLRTIPETETLKKLELSYLSLEEDYKEIFLDVACILIGWQKDKAVKALESCGFHARNGLRVLERKSLITIYKSYEGDHLGMHDHIVEMGRNIVRRSHPDKPHKHSRLWKIDEIEDILANDLGTKAARCIRFHTTEFNPYIFIKGLRKMKELRFLSVRGNCSIDLEFSIVGPDFPKALRYLHWDFYPFRSLPETFQANNLVALEMDGSKRKVLNRLRFLNLSFSRLSTFDLGLTPNLETLTLQNCDDLLDLHMTAGCVKLTSIDLNGSIRLRSLNLGLAPSIKELILFEFNDLEKLHLPGRCLNLRHLLLTNSRLRILDIGLTPNLEKLDLEKSYCLEELHMANEYQKLTELSITHSNLRTLDLGMIPNLEKLDLEKSYCLEELHMPKEYQKLTELIITHSNLRTIDLGMTPNLKKLVLTECRKLVELHTAIGCLKKLVHVDLSGCLRFISFFFNMMDCTSCSVDESLEVGPLAELHLMAESLESCPLHPDSNLPKFRFRCYYEDDRPSLTRNLEMLFSVGMCACTNLETFSRSICGLRRLRKLKLEGSFLEVLKVLDQLESLEELILLSTKINHLPDSICKLKHLKSLELKDLRLLERLPEDIGHLECLEELSLLFTNIKHLPDSIYMFKHLKSLKLRFCLLLEKLPENVGRLKHLEELALSCTNIKYLPDSICMLKHLKYLELNHCSLLEKLPDDLGRLEHLEELHLSKAEIKHLPSSICMLKSLKYLKIYGCSLHEKLPEDLGRLGCLEELDLSFTNIKHLPNSICMLKRLKYLELYHCLLLEKLPEDLGQLERLEVLSLGKCELLKNIPNSICEMKCLTCLHLRDCIRVDKLPEELERLECLKELDIKGTSISHLPCSIILLKGLHIIGFTPTP